MLTFIFEKSLPPGTRKLAQLQNGKFCNVSNIFCYLESFCILNRQCGGARRAVRSRDRGLRISQKGKAQQMEAPRYLGASFLLDFQAGAERRLSLSHSMKLKSHLAVATPLRSAQLSCQMHKRASAAPKGCSLPRSASSRTA